MKRLISGLTAMTIALTPMVAFGAYEYDMMDNGSSYGGGGGCCGGGHYDDDDHHGGHKYKKYFPTPKVYKYKCNRRRCKLKIRW